MKRKVSFPHLGSYSVPIEVLMTNALGAEYITPPPITKRTLEIGSKYSPDFVCSPFKYNLGNYIESIEKGANVLVQVGGACRLGYYGELHEQILKDLGYDIEFVNMAKANFSKPQTFINEFRKISDKVSVKKLAKIVLLAIEMVKNIDDIEIYIRENIGFCADYKKMDYLHQEYLEMLRSVKSKKELKEVSDKYFSLIKNIKTKKPKKVLKVGIIGEYYTIMEPFSNHFIEMELAKKGVVVTRRMNLSNSIFYGKKNIKKMQSKTKKYIKYDIGATGMYTIKDALELADDNYDGLIHVKSFGCTPEMDAAVILNKISSDYNIPIMYLSFDSQTSEVGIKTRLEAFYDMIEMRKEHKK